MKIRLFQGIKLEVAWPNKWHECAVFPGLHAGNTLVCPWLPWLWRSSGCLPCLQVMCAQTGLCLQCRAGSCQSCSFQWWLLIVWTAVTQHLVNPCFFPFSPSFKAMTKMKFGPCSSRISTERLRRWENRRMPRCRMFWCTLVWIKTNECVCSFQCDLVWSVIS